VTPRRRPLPCLLLLGVALALALAGGPEAFLAVVPFLVVAGLPASGRYVGATRIIARRSAAAVARRVARTAQRWQRRIERAPRLRADRRPPSRRGPPRLLPGALAD
jgi:hypothetical protein